MDNNKLYQMPFAKVYPLYLQKAERKGRTKEEVDSILYWLTGHDADSLQQVLDGQHSLQRFFDEAPCFHPNASLIKGSICGHRVEEIEDKLMWKIRCLDKLIDELAKGKALEKILRAG